jgi:hypothetical protein
MDTSTIAGPCRPIVKRASALYVLRYDNVRVWLIVLSSILFHPLDDNNMVFIAFLHDTNKRQPTSFNATTNIIPITYTTLYDHRPIHIHIHMLDPYIHPKGK